MSHSLSAAIARIAAEEARAAAALRAKGKCNHPEDPLTLWGVQVYIITANSGKLVEFLTKTVGAHEHRYSEGNSIVDLVLDIGGDSLLVAEKETKFEKRVDGGTNDSSSSLHLKTPNPESLGVRLVMSGAKAILPCEERFWSATYGQYEDPFGHIWNLSCAGRPTKEEVVPKPGSNRVVPFLLVRDAEAYMAWLREALGTRVVDPVAKSSDGKTVCATLEMNGGGTIVVGDVLDTTSGGDVSVSIILEVEPGRAADLAIDIEKNGGVIVDSPAPKFWGQGE